MKQLAKALCFCIAGIVFLCIAAAMRALSFLLNLPAHSIMAYTTQLWAKVMCMIVGVSVSVKGKNNLQNENAMLLVSNHLSYIDIIVVASVLPSLFVAKKEVQFWPLLGWLARMGGTIFVDRAVFRGGIAAANEVVKALQLNTNVHIFPEGTSSNGETVLQFKPSLFAASLIAKVPVLPLTIRYPSIDGKLFSEENRDIVCWYGNMEFTGHFLRMLQCKKIEALVTIHQPIIPSTFSTPQSLAFQAYAVVASSFQSNKITLLQKEAG